MINKIYNKIRNFILDEWKFLLVLICLIFITMYPVDCYVITGGGTISATDRVKVAGAKKKKGSFNLAYVSELKGTIYTYILSYIIPSYEREDISGYKYENEDSDVIDFRNDLLLKVANNNAIYVAYNAAHKKIVSKNKNLYVYHVMKEADTDLEVGDKIVEVDGHKIDDYEDLKKYLETLHNNDVVSIKIVKNDKTKTKTAKLYEKDEILYMGVSLLTDEDYDLSPKLDLKFKKSEGGPSGGLMMSLEIYSQLVNKDITNGKTIVGTGTIDRKGTVGEIDGIKYKLKGAVKVDADIFIAPTGNNYKEALKEKKKNKYKIRIIEAKTFEQVISELSK